MAIQSKSQRFANAVFPRVEEAARSAFAAKYKTLCKKAGSLVRNSGLMQTLAFFRARAARGEEHFGRLLADLEYEMNGLAIIPAAIGNEGEHLFDHVRRSSVPEYMYLTREALHLLDWHKRLAATLISKEEEE
jgi:CRISPR type III-B/RAMP module-associated protein Cmr5